VSFLYKSYILVEKYMIISGQHFVCNRAVIIACLNASFALKFTLLDLVLKVKVLNNLVIIVWWVHIVSICFLGAIYLVLFYHNTVSWLLYCYCVWFVLKEFVISQDNETMTYALSSLNIIVT
jgi:hypothetical protein